MRVFKFHAKKKQRFFEEDDVCYLMMQSTMGCTLRIAPSSNKIRGLAEPEKIKEFNKALTKAEIAAEENAAKKKENYVKELEEKYDGKLVIMFGFNLILYLFFLLEILQKYLLQEAQRKNLKQENIQTMGFYKTKKELDLEMGKHRR